MDSVPSSRGRGRAGRFQRGRGGNFPRDRNQHNGPASPPVQQPAPPVVEKRERITINYHLTDNQRAYFARLFPNLLIEQTPGARPHDHGVSALLRRLVEQEAIDLLRSKMPHGKWIVDIGGNSKRHEALGRRNIWSCQPLLDAKDWLRDRSHHSCLHKVADCTCPVLRRPHVAGEQPGRGDVGGYLAVHSLYYLDPCEVLALVNDLDNASGRLNAVTHLFPGHRGSLCDGELRYTADKEDVVVIAGHQLHSYKHDNMHWLYSGRYAADRDEVLEWAPLANLPDHTAFGMVWETERSYADDCFIITFTKASPFVAARPPVPKLDLSFLSVQDYYGRVDVRRIENKVSSGFVPDLHPYYVPIVSAYAAGPYMCATTTQGEFWLSKDAIYAAAKAAQAHVRSLDTYKIALNAANAVLTKENVPLCEAVAAGPICASIGCVITLPNEITALHNVTAVNGTLIAQHARFMRGQKPISLDGLGATTLAVLLLALLYTYYQGWTAHSITFDLLAVCFVAGVWWFTTSPASDWHRRSHWAANGYSDLVRLSLPYVAGFMAWAAAWIVFTPRLRGHAFKAWERWKPTVVMLLPYGGVIAAEWRATLQGRGPWDFAGISTSLMVISCFAEELLKRVPGGTYFLIIFEAFKWWDVAGLEFMVRVYGLTAVMHIVSARCTLPVGLFIHLAWNYWAASSGSRVLGLGTLLQPVAVAEPVPDSRVWNVCYDAAPLPQIRHAETVVLRPGPLPPCRPSLAGMLTGIGLLHHKPVMSRACAHNELRAIMSRMLIPTSTTIEWWAECFIFASCVLPGAPVLFPHPALRNLAIYPGVEFRFNQAGGDPITPMPFEAWVSRFPAAKANRLRAAHNHLKAKRCETIVKKILKVMVKQEWYLLKATTPRGILIASDEEQVVTGPWLAALQKHLEKWWRLDRLWDVSDLGQLGPFNTLPENVLDARSPPRLADMYACQPAVLPDGRKVRIIMGSTLQPAHWGAVLRAALQETGVDWYLIQGDDSVVIADYGPPGLRRRGIFLRDYHRYDGSQRIEPKRVLQTVYGFYAPPPTVAMTLEAVMPETVGLSRHGVFFSTDGGRASGRNDTLMGNGTLNVITSVRVDSITLGEPAETIVAAQQREFNAAGLPCDVVLVHDVFEADFCSGVFVPESPFAWPILTREIANSTFPWTRVDYVDPLRWVPFPGRILAKTFWCRHVAYTPEMRKTWTRTVCLGLFHDLWCVPFISAVLRRVWQLVGPGDLMETIPDLSPHAQHRLTLVLSMRDYWSKAMTLRRLEYSEEMLMWFSRRYGVVPHEVAAAEDELFKIVALPAGLDGSLIRAMVKRDVPSEPWPLEPVLNGPEWRQW